MSDTTTIQVHKKLKSKLDSLKEHSREPYSEVIHRLIDIAKESEESEFELSEETLSGIKEAREDLKKGRVHSTEQLRKELGL